MALEERKIFLNSPVCQKKSRQLSFVWPSDSSENVEPNRHPGKEIKDILRTFHKCVQAQDNERCVQMMEQVIEALEKCDFHDFEKMNDVCVLFNRTVGANFLLTLDTTKSYFCELIEDFFSEHVIGWSLSHSFPDLDETYTRPFFVMASGVTEILSTFFEPNKRRKIVQIGCGYGLVMLALAAQGYNRPAQFTGVEQLDGKVSLFELQALVDQYHKRMQWFGKTKNALDFITRQSFLDNDVLQVIENADVMILDPRKHSEHMKDKLRTEMIRIFRNGKKKEFYLVSIGEMFDFVYSPLTSNFVMENVGPNAKKSDAHVYCLKFTMQTESTDTSHSSLAASFSDMGDQSDAPKVSRKKRKNRSQSRKVRVKGHSYGSQKRRKMSSDDTSSTFNSSASSQMGPVLFSPVHQNLTPVAQDLPSNIFDNSVEQIEESVGIPIVELNSFVDPPSTIPPKEKERSQFNNFLPVDYSTPVISAVLDESRADNNDTMDANEIGVAGADELVSDDAMTELKPFPEAKLCYVNNCGVTLDFGYEGKMTLCSHSLRHHFKFFDEVLENAIIKDYAMPGDINVDCFIQFLRCVYKPDTTPIEKLQPDPLPDNPNQLLEIIALAFKYETRRCMIPAFVEKIYQSGLWSAAVSDKEKLFDLAYQHRQIGSELMTAAIKVACGIPVKNLMSMAIGSSDVEKKNLICKITEFAYGDITSQLSWEDVKDVEIE